MDHQGGSPTSLATSSEPGEALATHESATISYREVLARYTSEQLSETGSGALTAGTHTDTWLTRFKLNVDSPVGNELSVEFERYLSAFQNSASRAGTHPKTLANTVSTIRGLRKAYLAWLDGSDLPADFSEALRKAISRKGYTLRELRRQYQTTYGTEWTNYTKWFSGKTSPGYRRARPRTTIVLHRLEDLLNLPRDALTTRAFSSDVTPVLVPVKTRIAFRDHHSALVNDKGMNYSLRDLPAALQQEFDQLTAWKKKDRIMVKGKGFVAIESRHRWNKDSTVQAFLNDLKSFYGFLLLPADIPEESIPKELSETFGDTPAARRERYVRMMTGQGMALEDLRLTCVLNYELVDAYVTFRQARNLNENVTQTVAGFVVRILSLINRETSFLRHHPAFGSQLTPPVPTSEWTAWCDARHEEMAALARVLKKSSVATRTRNPDEPVLHLFAQKDPLKVLQEIGFQMLDTLPPPSSKILRATKFRNGMILLLLTFEPLRASHWPELRLGHHVVKDDRTGRWSIQISAEEFKNFTYGYAKDRQRVLPAKLSAIVDTYVTEHRPHFHRPDSDIFILKTRTGDSAYKKPEPQLSEQGFYNLIASIMESYLGIPVGPHVVRHIVATDHLRKHPGDFETAAALLNDSPETVRQAYSHVTQKNLLERRDSAFEDNLPKARRPL